MSEHEPAAENQAVIEKASKLRSMTSSPGWTDVFEPHIRSEIERYRRDVLTGEFADLLELKISQQKLQYLEYMIDYPRQKIAEADQLLSEEVQKEQNGKK
ncbi:MAG: hypothetical protein ACYST6_19620 [Planctomycetota bacterium]|jgi:hypothetical protein